MEHSNGQVFATAPSFVMPYMRGLTDEIENALFLRKFNVPFGALTYVFGNNEMYWYRIEQSWGEFSIAGYS